MLPTAVLPNTPVASLPMGHASSITPSFLSSVISRVNWLNKLCYEMALKILIVASAVLPFGNAGKTDSTAVSGPRASRQTNPKASTYSTQVAASRQVGVGVNTSSSSTCTSGVPSVAMLVSDIGGPSGSTNGGKVFVNSAPGIYFWNTCFGGKRWRT